MKRFVRILSIFAFALLCLALPLTITGCGEKADVELGDLNCTLHFNLLNVNEQGGVVKLKDGETPFGEIYNGSTKLTPETGVKVWEGSHVYVSKGREKGKDVYLIKIGNTKTYKTIKAIPRDGTNEFSYTYGLKEVDYGGITAIKEDVDVSVSFQRHPKTYNVIFDANGKTINETLPTNVTWTIGKNIVDGGFDDAKIPATTAGFKLATTTKQDTGRLQNIGFSLSPSKGNTSVISTTKQLEDSYVNQDKFSDSQISIENKTIRLFACWKEQTYTVNICKNVLTWKNQSAQVHTQMPDTYEGTSWQFLDSGVRVALYLNGEAVYDWNDEHVEWVSNGDHQTTSVRFKQIEFFNAQGQTIHYHIYASKSLAEIDTLVDTGRVVNVEWNNGNFQANKEYVAYQDVTLEKDENIESVSGNGTYLIGTQATITAVANEGYNFSKWTEHVVPEEGDPEDVEVSTQVSYTFEVNVPVTYTARAVAA